MTKKKFKEIMDLINEQSKRPETEAKHIGIEFEFVSPKEKEDILLDIFRLDLQNYCRLGEDSSIDTYSLNENAHELRVICKECELNKILSRLGILFKKIKAKVNTSCGLHVHLDMRTLNYKEEFKKLLDAKEILYDCVSFTRKQYGTPEQNSGFCFVNPPIHYRQIDRMHPSLFSKYWGINPRAYDKYKTIEIRMHHGTVDVDVVKNWIKILLKIKSNNKNMRRFGRTRKIKTLGIASNVKFAETKTFEFDNDCSNEESDNL